MGNAILKIVGKTKLEELKSGHESLFEISAKDIEGHPQLIGDVVKDKRAVVVVNVASE